MFLQIIAWIACGEVGESHGISLYAVASDGKVYTAGLNLGGGTDLYPQPKLSADIKTQPSGFGGFITTVTLKESEKVLGEVTFGS